MIIAGHDVPTPVVVGGGAAAAFFGYRYYKNKQAASAATSTTGASPPTSVIEPVLENMGTAPSTNLPTNSEAPDLTQYAPVSYNEAIGWQKRGAPVYWYNTKTEQIVPWASNPRAYTDLWIPWSWINTHVGKSGKAENTNEATGNATTQGAAAAARSSANPSSAAPQPGVTALKPARSAPSNPKSRPAGQGTSLALPQRRPPNPAGPPGTTGRPPQMAQPPAVQQQVKKAPKPTKKAA